MVLAASSQDRHILEVYRPMLPPARAVAGYLETLDVSRRYTNRGELTTLLEARLSRRLGLGPEQMVLTASGTAGLTAAILATAGRARPDKPYCLCPGYLFAAGALAAEQCGFLPYFVDIEARDWTSSPQQLLRHPEIGRAGVILAAAPYGRAVPSAAYQELGQRTGVPVVIDAAASIEAFADGTAKALGSTPIVFSFHATKAFACGEGGAVLSSDSTLLHRVYAALNFGFAGTRETSGPGFNGKLSEYHAAVGLAELDSWDTKRSALAQVAVRYRRAAAPAGLLLHTAPDIASNYVLLQVASAGHAHRVCASLDQAEIGNRHWYGLGLHRQPHFRDAARDPLPGVEALAPCLIGLPVAHDLEPDAIGRIIEITARAAGTVRTAPPG